MLVIPKLLWQNFYDLKSLIKVPTCLKNPDKLKCVDLVLTNRPNLF